MEGLEVGGKCPAVEVEAGVDVSRSFPIGTADVGGGIDEVRPVVGRGGKSVL